MVIEHCKFMYSAVRVKIYAYVNMIHISTDVSFNPKWHLLQNRKVTNRETDRQTK